MNAFMVTKRMVKGKKELFTYTYIYICVLALFVQTYSKTAILLNIVTI